MQAELGFPSKLGNPGPDALVITPGLKRVGPRTGVEQAWNEDSLGKSLDA